jgi:hypothetical protein
LRDTLHGYSSEVLDRALTDISPEDVATLRRLLQQMKRNLV